MLSRSPACARLRELCTCSSFFLPLKCMPRVKAVEKERERVRVRERGEHWTRTRPDWSTIYLRSRLRCVAREREGKLPETWLGFVGARIPAFEFRLSRCCRCSWFRRIILFSVKLVRARERASRFVRYYPEFWVMAKFSLFSGAWNFCLFGWIFGCFSGTCFWAFFFARKW